ncbi:hypothetical protein [Pontibacter ruber]|uniref:STAS/SEC14 domain-containing protein n=1 Tax=Pontibacter ruber TaxID=1343895 RepID=A0ABW5CQT9_9BACT|nr:hypothetical protein [Pontibacter ruber]
MLFFHDANCTIEVFQDKSLLKLTWLTQPDYQSFKDCFTIGLELAVQYKVTHWLSDNSTGTNMDMAMQRFATEAGARYLYNTRIVRFAKVVPLDVFQEVVFRKVLDRFNSITSHTIDFEIFGNVDLALSWLFQDQSMSASA